MLVQWTLEVEKTLILRETSSCAGSELRVKNGHYLGVCFKYIPVQRHNLEHARRRANASLCMEQTVHDVKRREIMPER